MSLFGELRRRGVLGAVVAYGVAAAGALQLADIVVHNLDLPAWTLRALIWLAALGLPAVGVISWFYDLTRRGLVRTQMPGASPQTPRMQTPQTLPAAVEQELRPGALLAGRYRIEGELGKGGMGRVLAARDDKLGRRVAVKVVTGAHDPVRIRRFEQEARTAGALEHPNVLAVYDLGEHEGVPFLVTELLEGHTLRTLLRDGALSAAQAQNLILQLARGLSAAHARGIVHRDLKPENLFVTADGRLKILDFGLARLTTDDPGSQGLTQTGALFGTPGYLSPEQARGEKAGPPSDVFSAGAVLYEMLSGRRAFPGASLIEAGHAAINSEPAPLPITVPPTLEGVVTRSLQKEPARRFGDGGELARSLEALAAATQPLPGLAMPRKSWRRSTAVMVSLAALALGAALASGLRVSRSARRSDASGSSRSHRVPPPMPEIPVPPVAPRAPVPPEVEVPEPPDEDDEDAPQRGARQRAIDREKIARDIQKELQHKAPRWGRQGVIAGANALERANQIGRAENLLRKQRDPIAHLELYLLQRRAGRPEARSELLAFLKSHPGGDWPAPLLQAYAGTLGDDRVLAEARKSGDSEDVCEAWYYLGELHQSAELLKKASSDQCDESERAQSALESLQSR